MKICAIIPAYNVESTIEEVVRGVNRFLQFQDIVIIDDGSGDDTVEKAKRTGATVLRNEVNRGKGYSLKRGFEYAIDNWYDAVISLDADLQHDPLEIPKFIQCYSQQNADLVLGDRTHDLSSMPIDRQFSNKTTSLIISLLTGQRVRDSQNGYRLMKTEVLKRIHLTSDRYEMESELLVKSLINKFRIAHVPIGTIYGDQQSHIHRFVDTLRFIRVVVRSLIQRN